MHAFLFRPKWIAFHVLVIAAVLGMLSASKWQWTKYNARRDFVAMVEARQDRRRTPPQPLTELLDGRSPADAEYRVATASGSYLTSGQLIEINRTQDDVNGVDVLTPFQVDGGPIVIVNRGFVADGQDVAPPPSGTLVVGGTVRRSELRRTGELTDNEAGAAQEVRRVDIALIARRLDLTVAPVYLDLLATDPASPQPPVPVPAPDVSGGPPHLSYTIQWLIFASSAAVGWVFAVRRSVRTRRRMLALGPDEDGAARGQPSA